MDNVCILGAGLAGLGCARALPGAVVYEAADHPGGHAYSHPMGGLHFDEGAHICHSKRPAFLSLITCAAGNVAEPERSIVRNYWRDRWLTYPVQNHLHELPLEARVPALTALVEAHTRGGTEPRDYREWCLRQYGSYLTQTFYDDFTAKYWRTGGEDLAMDWFGGRLVPASLPRIIEGAFAALPESQTVFSRFRYPARGGFFQFFSPLCDPLPIRCGERAVEIDARDKTVLFSSGRRVAYDVLASSIPLPDLVRLVKDAPRHVLDSTRKLRSTQLLCVNLIVDRPRLSDCHWFYIYGSDVDAARVSIPSNLAAGSAPDGVTALQAEIFRRDDEALPVDLLIDRTVAHLGRILDFARSDVREAGHVHVPRAYVISDHDRAATAAGLLSWLSDLDIFSMGLYGRWQYVWSDEALEQGERTAQAIRRRLGAADPPRRRGRTSA